MTSEDARIEDEASLVERLKPRRIVIGVNEDGASETVIDDVAPHIAFNRTYPGIASNTLWKESPSLDISSRADHAALWSEMAVPTDGTRFYLVTIGAGVEAGLHATPTIEYHYVVSGAITITLEGEDVEAKAGDVIVMRGVPHGWRNDHDEPFISAAVQVGMHSSLAGTDH